MTGSESRGQQLDAPAERRPVTVMFADLVGFTALSVRINAEELHEMLGRVCDAVDGVIERYGGSVEKHIGDAVMAMFGVPAAHMDDPQRALWAASEIHELMPKLSAETGQPLSMHIGVASGEVVAGRFGGGQRQRYAILGQPVNLAARLQDQANSGQTLISESVYRAAYEMGEFRSMGELELKGFDTPVLAWSVLSVLPPGSRVAQPPFVNRTVEQDWFRRTMRRVQASSRGVIVMLRGEPGIGKSRLAIEFCRIAEAFDLSVHRVQFVDFGSDRAGDPIKDLVRSVLRGCIDEGGADVVSALTANGVFSPSECAVLSDLVDVNLPPDLIALRDAMDGHIRSEMRVTLAAKLLRFACRRAPQMLLVEDLHWGNREASAHLVRLVALAKELPVVVLFTARRDSDAVNAAWFREVIGDHTQLLEINPLSDGDAHALLRSVAGRTSDELRRRCVQRAEGNPLFLEHLLRNAGVESDEELPESINRLVLSRVDGLPHRERTALRAASILGQRFSPELLNALEPGISADWKSLVQHGLIKFDGSALAFTHALVRDSVYASLVSTHRNDLHQRAAEWFRTRNLSLCAEHLERANDPSAADIYLQAAEERLAIYRYEQAQALVERGLSLDPAREQRFRLLLAMGRIHSHFGRKDAALSAFRDAAAHAESAPERCQAQLGIANGFDHADRYHDALAVLEDAKAAAHEARSVSLLAETHLSRGRIFHSLGELERTRQDTRRAVRYARMARSPALEAEALCNLGYVYYQRGLIPSAHRCFSTWISLCDSNNLRSSEAQFSHMLGHTLMYLNRLNEALLHGRKVVALAERIGSPRSQLHADRLIALVLSEMGRWDDAAEQVQRALAEARALGAGRYEPVLLCVHAAVAAHRGRLDDTESALDEAYALCKDVESHLFGGFVLGARARLSRRTAVRRASLEEGDEILREGGISHNILWFYRDAMQACLDDRRWDDVDRYASLLSDYTRREDVPWAAFHCQRARHLARIGRGGSVETSRKALAALVRQAKNAGMGRALPAMLKALD